MQAAMTTGGAALGLWGFRHTGGPVQASLVAGGATMAFGGVGTAITDRITSRWFSPNRKTGAAILATYSFMAASVGGAAAAASTESPLGTGVAVVVGGIGVLGALGGLIPDDQE